MLGKCCTFFGGVGCTTNYKISKEKFPVFTFPKEEEEEKQRWISLTSNCLQLDSKFHHSAFKRNTRIETRDRIASLSYRLYRYSQITALLEKLESYPLPITKEMKAAASDIKILWEVRSSQIEKHQRRISFFMCNQMLCQHSREFTTHIDNIKDAFNIFLKGRRAAYRQARDLLYLPIEAPLKTYFDILGTPESIENCRNTVGKYTFS